VAKERYEPGHLLKVCVKQQAVAVDLERVICVREELPKQNLV